MKLVVLYGPPAVGKLTIGTKLAELTNFKLFHNHLTQDLARELYPEFGELRFGLVERIRADVIAYAAEHDTDLIFTFVHDGSESDKRYIAEVTDTVVRSKGRVYFVELTADADTLLQRVADDSRKRFHKLKDPEVLRQQLTTGMYDASLAKENAFKLDTTHLQPTQAAEAIVRHFGL